MGLMSYDRMTARIVASLAALAAIVAAVRLTWHGLRRLGRLADAFLGDDATPGVLDRLDRIEAKLQRIEEKT